MNKIKTSLRTNLDQSTLEALMRVKDGPDLQSNSGDIWAQEAGISGDTKSHRNKPKDNHCSCLATGLEGETDDV